jgi:hypothetical protein
MSVHVPLVEPQIIEAAECPQPLDECGRAGWPQVTGLQTHIMLVQLMGELERMKSACALCDRRRPQRPPYPPEQRPTPRTMVEAIMTCIAARGRAALREPANIERLRRCDAAARRQINARLAKIRATL